MGDLVTTVQRFNRVYRQRIAQIDESFPGSGRSIEFDRRSDDLAVRIVEPLSVRQRTALCDAMATADRLLCAATATFHAVDPGSPDARWALGQYYAELNERFPTGFDPGDPPPPTLFVVVQTDGQTIGCGGVQTVDENTGEIKRMWVAEEFRGSGIGHRLLHHLEQLVRDLGCGRVVLDTNAVLTDAIAMYERSGYLAIERYNDNPYAMHWFEKSLRP